MTFIRSRRGPIEGQVTQRMEMDKRLKVKEGVRKEVIIEVMNSIAGENKKERKMVNRRLHEGINVFELFEEIGVEKIKRIRDTKVETITDITKKGIKYVKDYF